MANKHLEEKTRKFKDQGLDLETLKNKIYNWLAIEIDNKVNIDKKIEGKDFTTREKMHDKADELGEIIHEYIQGAIVYVELSDVAESEYSVRNEQGDQLTTSPLEFNNTSSDGNINMSRDETVGNSSVKKNYNLRIK